MKWLYFTRSNADIDCLPEKTVSRYHLKTETKRRSFIGDSGAGTFSLQDAVINPVWDEDGELYIPNQEEISLEKINKLTYLYDDLDSYCIVEANDRLYNFSKSKRIDFFSEYMLLEEVSGRIRWLDYSNTAHLHTKEEALNIINAIKIYLRGIFDAKQSDKALIMAGEDPHNLKDIKAEQDSYSANKV